MKSAQRWQFSKSTSKNKPPKSERFIQEGKHGVTWCSGHEGTEEVRGWMRSPPKSVRFIRFGKAEEVWLQKVLHLGKRSWLSEQGVLRLQALEGHLEPSPYSPHPYKTFVQNNKIVRNKMRHY